MIWVLLSSREALADTPRIMFDQLWSWHAEFIIMVFKLPMSLSEQTALQLLWDMPPNLRGLHNKSLFLKHHGTFGLCAHSCLHMPLRNHDLFLLVGLLGNSGSPSLDFLHLASWYMRLGSMWRVTWGLVKTGRCLAHICSHSLFGLQTKVLTLLKRRRQSIPVPVPAKRKSDWWTRN